MLFSTGNSVLLFNGTRHTLIRITRHLTDNRSMGAVAGVHNATIGLPTRPRNFGVVSSSHVRGPNGTTFIPVGPCTARRRYRAGGTRMGRRRPRMVAMATSHRSSGAATVHVPTFRGLGNSHVLCTRTDHVVRLRAGPCSNHTLVRHRNSHRL